MSLDIEIIGGIMKKISIAVCMAAMFMFGNVSAVNPNDNTQQTWNWQAEKPSFKDMANKGLTAEILRGIFQKWPELADWNNYPREFNLSNNPRFGDAGLAELWSKVNYLTYVNKINLSNTGLTDASVDTIADIIKGMYWGDVYLEDNYLSEEGIAAINDKIRDAAYEVTVHFGTQKSSVAENNEVDNNAISRQMRK